MKFGKYFGPMLLTQVNAPFNDKRYIYEFKFDGIRAIIHVNKKKILIYTRNGNEISRLFPELKSICSLVEDDVIFDGEIVLFKNKKPSFHELVKRIRMKDIKKINYLSNNEPVVFMVFDVIYKNGDLSHLPLIERKEILDKFSENDNFIKTKYVYDKGVEIFKIVKKLDLEGIVAKRYDSNYRINTRVDDWIKIKNYKSGIFYIGGYDIKNVRISLSLGEYKNDKFLFVGKVAVERTNKVLEKLMKMSISKKNSFSLENIKIEYYVKPLLKCKISFISRTPNGHLREPVFVSLV